MFVHIWNGGWLTILNMTTIGYGEAYPTTHLGRFTVIVSCIVGVFLLSELVVAVSNLIEFNDDQEKAYTGIRNEMYKDKTLKKHAASVISFWWKIILSRRSSDSPRQRLYHLFKLGKRTIRF